MVHSTPSFSLIIPTYNEADNIVRLLQAVHAALGDRTHEVLVVDDDSPDQTWKRAQDFADTHTWVRVLRRKDARGLSRAVLAGFEQAQGDILGVIDADGSHDEKILLPLIAAVEAGAEMAVGSRRIAGGGATEWPWYRRGMSSLATALARMSLHLPLADPMSGYFVIPKSLYSACRDRLRPSGYKILVEICCKARLTRIQEIPFIFKDRKQGQSKLTSGVVRQYFQMLVMLKLDRFVQWLRFQYHTGRYKKVKAWLKPGTLLDIGCGQPCESMPDGSFLRFLGRGVGIDVKPCHGPFEFVQGSILELPFPAAQFDNVVAMEILEHVSDPHKALSEIKRVLRDDGRVVISIPEESWLWEKIWSFWEHSFGYLWHHTHEGTRPPAEWLPIFEAHFVIEKRRRHWYFDLIFSLRKPAAADSPPL